MTSYFLHSLRNSPIVAVTHYQKFTGLKSTNFSSSSSVDQKSDTGLTKIKVSAGLIPFWRLSGRIRLSQVASRSLFELQEATCIPWLMVSSSTFKASNLGGVLLMLHLSDPPSMVQSLSSHGPKSCSLSRTHVIRLDLSG